MDSWSKNLILKRRMVQLNCESICFPKTGRRTRDLDIVEGIKDGNQKVLVEEDEIKDI